MDRVAFADARLFEGFRLDCCGLARLDQAGVAEPVALGSRALDLLRLLTERQGELVSKDAIMEAVWPETVVEEGNLTVQISALRRVLDQNRERSSCIQTIPGRGYRFVAPVTRGDKAVPPGDTPASGNGIGTPIAEDEEAQNRSAPTSVDAIRPVPASRDRHRFWGGIPVAAAAVLVLITALVAWNWDPPPSTEAPSAPRLSIVVLPFANLNNDPEQQYFIDAVTEDLTTDLSRISGSFVISRNTALTYRNKPVDTKQIGRELGVRYVLEGSVRRSGKQIRINTQLIDAETNAHLWAERFEGDTSDLFALENDITYRIAVALELELIGAEAARPTANPDALDSILRGRAARAKPASRENYQEAIGLFERALALDPKSAEAQSRLASVLVARVLDVGSSSEAADISRAEELAASAVAMSPRSWIAHDAKGQVLRVQRRCAEAIPEYEAALALNRNAVAALADIGRCKLYIGPIEEAILAHEQAIRLSPRDPQIANWYWRIGEAHLLQSHIDEAILWLKKAHSVNQGFFFVHGNLAAAYALKGDSVRAAASLAEARRVAGEGSYSSIARLRAVARYEAPAIRALAEATFLTGLRMAGVPEE